MNYRFSERVLALQPSAIREILKFTSDPQVIPFAAGNPAADAFPIDVIREISQKILEKDPILALQYSVTEGYVPLRELLKKRLEKQGCFRPGQDELIMVSGAQQGVELSAKVMCNEGDTLVCEAPSFIGSLNSFKSYRIHLEGVEMEQDGVDLDRLEETLKSHPNTKLLYTIPNFQNPTGLTMSEEKRKAVYELAKKYDFLILEDNPYGDLRFEGEDVPPIKSLDTEGRVLYCGSFSKVLAPGLRVGYVSGPKEVLQKLVVCKQGADVHTNIWAQAVCFGFLTTSDMDAHLARLREIYRAKAQRMMDGIEAHFSRRVSYTRPQGGLFLWCTLPEGSDMMGFCSRAVQERKVAVVPGSAFMVRESDQTTSFRMNYSTPSDQQIDRGCELLGMLSKEMFD